MVTFPSLNALSCHTPSKPLWNLLSWVLTQNKTAPEMTNKDGMIWSCDKESNVGITTLMCRQVEEDRGDVLSLVESDDEQIFQDTVPRLPPITNGCHTTLVQIHRIPSSMTSSWRWFYGF